MYFFTGVLHIIYGVKPLFIMNINTSKPKTRIVIILSAVVLTALAAVLVSVFWQSGTDTAAFETDLAKTGGVEGFLGQFSLEVQDEISRREITFPQSDDKVFSEYGGFQEKLGFKVLELSGKKVEERYLRLKNKNEKGKTLYAVVITLKERVVAAHITTFEQGAGLLALDKAD